MAELQPVISADLRDDETVDMELLLPVLEQSCRECVLPVNEEAARGYFDLFGVPFSYFCRRWSIAKLIFVVWPDRFLRQGFPRATS